MSEHRRKKPTPPPVEIAETPRPATIVAMPKNLPQPPPAAGKARHERIGDALRQARLDRNEDLYHIAEYLCIKPAFLVALENSRYDAFAADAYVIGFLRTYANFLGLDGKEAVDRYRSEMTGQRKKPVLAMPTPVSEGRAPSGLIMVGAGVVLLLIYALWYGISSANRTEVNAPPPLPAASQLAAPESSPSAAAGLTAPVTNTIAPPADSPATDKTGMPPVASGIVLTSPAPPATLQKPDMKDDTGMAGDSGDSQAKADKAKAKPDTAQASAAKESGKQIYGDPDQVAHVMIRATQTSWVMIADSSGKTVFDHVLKAGDIYKVPNQPGLVMTTGNGAGLDILVDNVEAPKVAAGAPHVVHDISLDPARLSAGATAQ